MILFVEAMLPLWLAFMVLWPIGAALIVAYRQGREGRVWVPMPTLGLTDMDGEPTDAALFGWLATLILPLIPIVIAARALSSWLRRAGKRHARTLDEHRREYARILGMDVDELAREIERERSNHTGVTW